jgi:hypothetical protein
MCGVCLRHLVEVLFPPNDQELVNGHDLPQKVTSHWFFAGLFPGDLQGCQPAALD